MNSSAQTRIPCTKVHFARGVSLPLPGFHGVTVHTLETPDHGLFHGSLLLWVNLETRVLQVEMQADTYHLNVWVPFEQLSSWVLDYPPPV